MTPEEYQAWIEAEPRAWVNKVYGIDVWDKQQEIISSVFKHRRTAVKGCVASSKSVCAAIVVHAWLQRYTGGKVYLTAPSDRQVKNVLWTEVRALYNNAKVPLGGNMLPSDSRWDMPLDGWFAHGFSTNDPNRFHGIHGGIFGAHKKILFIIDEWQGISQPINEAIENVMSDGMAHMLTLQNPSALSGESHEAFNSKKHLYNCITIAAKDTPNYKAGKIVIPGMITKDQYDEWVRTYGPTSNFVRVKGDAEFPLQEPDTLIPMHWIELAMQREVPQLLPHECRPAIGQDVAWEGDDLSVKAKILGRQLMPLEIRQGLDPMEVADALDIDLIGPSAIGCVDSIGIGAGVYAREAQRKRNVHAINVAEEAVGPLVLDGKTITIIKNGKEEPRRAKDHFFNLRTQILFNLRWMLNPENPEAIALPKDLKLQAELSAIKFFTDERTGKVRIQLKKDMKKALGYSPDRADGVALACWAIVILAMDVAIADWAKSEADRLPQAVGDDDGEGQALPDGFFNDGVSETLAGLGPIE